MDFQESLIGGFAEKARSMAGFTKEKERIRTLERMKESSCQAFQEIRKALSGEDLEDRECRLRIEKIVEIYEALGSGGRGAA